ADCQHLLDVLYREMKPAADVVELDDVEGPLSDEEVVEMAMRAANADKFNALCRGGWQAMGYASQSEADFALLSILAYYTRDNEPVRRLFRTSQLGKREQAQKSDKYLDYALSKIGAQQPPPLDFEELKANMATAASIPE